MIAEIIVNSSANELNRIFDYKVPDDYEIGKSIDIGYRVLVSFANYKNLEIGYIIGFKENSEFKCKTISKVCDRAFDEKKLKLAKDMAKRYFCNLSDTLKLLVPPGTSNSIEKVKIKYEKWVRLSKDYLEFLSSKEDDKKYKIKTEKQQRIIDFLLDNKEIPVAIITDITGATSSILKTLTSKGICEFFDMEVLRSPFFNKNVKRDNKLELTPSQTSVLNNIKVCEYGEYLIHGVTRKWKNRSISATYRKSFRKR